MNSGSFPANAPELPVQVVHQSVVLNGVRGPPGERGSKGTPHIWRRSGSVVGQGEQAGGGAVEGVLVTGDGAAVGGRGAAVGGEVVRLRRAAGGVGRGEVVRPADQADVVGAHVLLAEVRVRVRRALGGLGVGELRAVVLDRGPVDVALVAGD